MTPLAQRLPDQLYQLLLSDIHQGVFPVGAQLPIEGDLCERYGVSRTVLRETVARLKADGVLEVRQGRGSFVLPQSLKRPFRFDPSTAGSVESVRKLAELRLGVEATAAGLAAARRTPEQLERLSQHLAQMAQAVRTGASGTEADLQFHETIAEATGNEHYRLFMDYLRQTFVVAIDTARTSSARRAGLSQAVQDEHQAIHDAIAAGDIDAAELAMKRHIRNAADRLTTEPLHES